jgi:hypothetical protein
MALMLHVMPGLFGYCACQVYDYLPNCMAASRQLAVNQPVMKNVM